jgi:CRP-like cAMP-binding protein
MDLAADPRQNRLLAAMSADVWERLQPQLEFVDMPLGAVLYESGEVMSHVFFPATSIVSKIFVTKNGATAEIAMVGREGMIGVAQLLGGQSAPDRAVVQIAGYGFRLRSSVLTRELGELSPLARTLLRYTQALLVQTSQIAVCNRHHSIEQQLCRWLLLSLDRLHSNDIAITHELIASMLGVRRQGVSAAARGLLEAGVIGYRQGRITVLDRNKLEQRCCECYSVINVGYKHLLPETTVT